MADYGKMIRAMIRKSSQVTDQVGARVYPDILPNNTSLPAIAFVIENISVGETKDWADEWDELSASIIIYAKTRGNAESVSDSVRRGISIYKTTPQTAANIAVRLANHRGERWEYIEDFTKSGTSTGQGVFIQIMDYRIVAKFPTT